MSDKFDSFLKKNAPTPPRAPANEKQRIWAKITAAQSPWWAGLFTLPQLRIAIPALAALAIVAGTMQVQKHKRNAEVERVLALALAYQIEEITEDQPF